MKTYNLFGFELTISIKSFWEETSEYCVYYDVCLKDSVGKQLIYLDFDYVKTKRTNEDDLFDLFIGRGADCFDDAIDENGNSICNDVKSFVGCFFLEEMSLLKQITR